MHNQHAGLSQQLAAQRMNERQEQAVGARLAHGARPHPHLSARARPTLRKEETFPVPMQPIHRLVHLAQRSDGGVEWACPQCGRYLVRHPDTELVLVAGAPGPAHILGPGYRDDPSEGLAVSEFDEQFLHRHAMAWSADHRPN